MCIYIWPEIRILLVAIVKHVLFALFTHLSAAAMMKSESSPVTVCTLLYYFLGETFPAVFGELTVCPGV